MARSFLGFGQQNYIGTKFIVPVQQVAPSAMVAPLQFQWISYQPKAPVPANINVLVDISSLPGQTRTLDKIASIYIDNLGVAFPVYVYFPDTGHTVVAPPNTAGWYLVFTNGKIFWVVGLGLISNDLSKTNILAANFYMPPSSDEELPQSLALWLASPSISRGTTILNTRYGTPALGDISEQKIISVLTLGPNLQLFNTPQPTGFIYLTAVAVNVFDWQTGGGTTQADLRIWETSSGQILYDFIMNATVNNIPAFRLFSETGLNLKLDATVPWKATNFQAFASGYWQLYLNWTFQP